SPEQEAQHMVDHSHMGEWMQEVRRGKALSAIVAAATITDEDGARVDLARINSDGSLAGDDSEVVEADITEVEVVEESTVSEAEEA
ncbi:MAG: trigger factor, partial [Propionibacterium sp.]|nr:trigger factor [Propionibacterium sp.]